MPGEPRAGGRIDHAPQRIEVLLAVARDAPRVVLFVVSRSRAAGDVARAVRLSDGLDPQVGVEQRHARVSGRSHTKTGARRVAPRARGEAMDDRGGLGEGGGRVLCGIQRAVAVAVANQMRSQSTTAIIRQISRSRQGGPCWPW